MYNPAMFVMLPQMISCQADDFYRYKLVPRGWGGSHIIDLPIDYLASDIIREIQVVFIGCSLFSSSLMAVLSVLKNGTKEYHDKHSHGIIAGPVEQG